MFSAAFPAKWNTRHIVSFDNGHDSRSRTPFRKLFRQGRARSPMNSGIASNWGADWAWCLPLVAATVVLHAHVLRLVGKEVHTKLNNSQHRWNSSPSLTY